MAEAAARLAGDGDVKLWSVYGGDALSMKTWMSTQTASMPSIPAVHKMKAVPPPNSMQFVAAFRHMCTCVPADLAGSRPGSISSWQVLNSCGIRLPAAVPVAADPLAALALIPPFH